VVAGPEPTDTAESLEKTQLLKLIACLVMKFDPAGRVFISKRDVYRLPGRFEILGVEDPQRIGWVVSVREVGP
jgi:hypothetical protein